MSYRKQFGLLICLAGVALPAMAAAADTGGYIVLTSDYVKRGVTQSDSSGAVQIGIDVTMDAGLFLGVWASTTDISNGPTRQRDLELNYYAGYSHAISKWWNIAGNVVLYTYPGTEGAVDYDYVEYSLTANFDDRVWIEYSFSPDLYKTGLQTHNLDIYAEWSLGKHSLIGAGAGYYDVSSLTGSAYSYWQLGITRPFKWFDVDLRYHDASQSVPVISAPDRVGERFVVSVTFQF